MIKIRHVLHPLNSARSLYQLGKRAYKSRETAYYKRVCERANSKIKRGEVSQCWCGGALRPLASSVEYAACEVCGCYVNIRPPLPEGLKEFYSLKGYWRMCQKAYATVPIEERGELYRSDGRLDYWLSLVQRYAPGPCSAVEIGCAPGVLLSELAARGYDCTGVEPHGSTAEWIRRTAKIKVLEGMFPGVVLPRCSLLLSFDVAEHTPTPMAFWSGISDSLNSGGVAIIQTPIECVDYENPFKDRPDFFDSIQHLYLYTDRSIGKLTSLANLELLSLEDALGTLGQVCVLRKPLGSAEGEGLTL
jgi:SAM-dependent methyltransferase